MDTRLAAVELTVPIEKIVLARDVAHNQPSLREDTVGVIELQVERQVADAAGVDHEGRLSRQVVVFVSTANLSAFRQRRNLPPLRLVAQNAFAPPCLNATRLLGLPPSAVANTI
jgi:hypothetical protein